MGRARPGVRSRRRRPTGHGHGHPVGRRCQTPQARRIVLVGGAGSGKTALATRLAAETGLRYYDLDGLLLDVIARAPEVGTQADLVQWLRGQSESWAEAPEWVADGVYTWAAPLLERAEQIIWLDIPWRVTGYRILARHVKAELAGDNRFPGWRRLWRFWNHSRRFYADANDDDFNEVGTPLTRHRLATFLEQYGEKLLVCRRSRDIALLFLRR